METIPKTPYQSPTFSAHADLQIPLRKFNHGQYLDTYNLDICTTMDDL